MRGRFPEDPLAPVDLIDPKEKEEKPREEKGQEEGPLQPLPLHLQAGEEDKGQAHPDDNPQGPALKVQEGTERFRGEKGSEGYPEGIPQEEEEEPLPRKPSPKEEEEGKEKEEEKEEETVSKTREVTPVFKDDEEGIEEKEEKEGQPGHPP